MPDHESSDAANPSRFLPVQSLLQQVSRHLDTVCHNPWGRGWGAREDSAERIRENEAGGRIREMGGWGRDAAPAERPREGRRDAALLSGSIRRSEKGRKSYGCLLPSDPSTITKYFIALED